MPQVILGYVVGTIQFNTQNCFTNVDNSVAFVPFVTTTSLGVQFLGGPGGPPGSSGGGPGGGSPGGGPPGGPGVGGPGGAGSPGNNDDGLSREYLCRPFGVVGLMTKLKN